MEDLRAEEVCKAVRDALRLGGGGHGGAGNDFTMKPMA